MNQFTFYLYQYFHEIKSSNFQIKFSSINDRIDLFEKQYNLTLKLYEKEYKIELEGLKTLKNERLEDAQIAYNKAYDEMDREDPQIRDGYAENQSGLNAQSEYYFEEKLRIKDKYLEFIDLYSKSILISLFSLVESSLKRLCEISSTEFNLKLKYEILSTRDYVMSSINYFEFVVDLNILKLTPNISKIKDIQFLRNRIIHSESSFSDNNLNTLNEIVKKSKGSLGIKSVDSLNYLQILKRTFIDSFITNIRELFGILKWELDIKSNNKDLKTSLKYWFGIIDENVFVTNVLVSSIKKEKKEIKFNLSSRKRSIPKMKVHMKLQNAKDSTLEILDQTNNDSINRFVEVSTRNEHFVFNLIHTFLNRKSGVKISIMIFE